MLKRNVPVCSHCVGGSVYASTLVCAFICVYVSEEGMGHSPGGDLLLAAGQVSCLAVSL